MAHVANKDELLDLLLDRISAEVEVPDPDPAHWQDQLRSVGRQSYQVFRRHRDHRGDQSRQHPDQPELATDR